MRTFFTLASLSYRGLFLWRGWWPYSSNLLIAPILTLMIFALAGRFAGDPAASQGYLIGMALALIPSGMAAGILQSFAVDRHLGTLASVLATPTNRLLLYLSRGAPHAPNGIATTTVGLVFAVLFLGLDGSRLNWPAAAISIVVVAASCTTFLLLIGSLSLVLRDWRVLRQIVGGLLLLLTGAVIPVLELPPVLREVAPGLPVTHGLVALRGAFDGADLGAIAGSLGQESLVGLVYLLVGFAAFRGVEVLARRRGTLYLEPV